jgi:hypothetical protein
MLTQRFAVKAAAIGSSLANKGAELRANKADNVINAERYFMALFPIGCRMN